VPGEFAAAAPTPWRDTDQALVGPPEHRVAVLTELSLELGFSDFLLVGPPDPDVLRTFIQDVEPAVRERVAQARARTGPAEQRRQA
jgi:alkanesulfonate monooxygenase SsuD/methylene tetrahydromethanopterin reductase-like flavin-dependent oxidoreductase (luciferase family)